MRRTKLTAEIWLPNYAQILPRSCLLALRPTCGTSMALQRHLWVIDGPLGRDHWPISRGGSPMTSYGDLDPELAELMALEEEERRQQD